MTTSGTFIFFIYNGILPFYLNGPLCLRFLVDHVYEVDHFVFVNGSWVVFVKHIKNVDENFIWDVADGVFHISLGLFIIKFAAVIGVVLCPNLVDHLHLNYIQFFVIISK